MAGPLPTIASLSLGGTRDFLLKHKADGGRRERFLLESGDLVVMRGTTQSNWLHSIPKRAQASSPTCCRDLQRNPIVSSQAWRQIA